MTSLHSQSIASHSIPVKGLYTPTQSHSKSSQAKALGSNADLSAWYERAYDYYNEMIHAVQNGSATLPEGWDEFLNQMNWAYSQLQGGESWDPMGMEMGMEDGMSFGDPMGQELPASDPFGGIPGTLNNIVHNEEKAEVGFTGDCVRDIWSNDVTINVAPMSAEITAERTTDSRWQPAEEVIKIIVRDRATGTEAVYFIHDAADAEIKIKSPSESQLNDMTGGAVTWSKFKSGAERDARPESSHEGQPVEGEDNAYNYVAETVNDTIQFRPRAGENEVHYVTGNADVSPPLDARSHVQRSDNPDYAYMMTVTHADGSKDTYYFQDEFKFNVNTVEEYVSFDLSERISGGGSPSIDFEVDLPGVDIPEDARPLFEADLVDSEPADEQPLEIPAEISEFFTVNGGGGEDAQNNIHPDDTQPRDTSEDGHTAYYDTEGNVELHANFEDRIDRHEIYTNGEALIHTSDWADDRVTVQRIEDESGVYFIVTVFKAGGDGDASSAGDEVFIVRGASKITIDGRPENITGADDPIVQRGVGGAAAAPTEEAASESERNEEGRAIAENLANLPGNYKTGEEILQAATDTCLDITNLPSDPTNPAVIEFLMTIDDRLKTLFESYLNSSGAANSTTAAAFRDRLVELFAILYPSASPAAGDDGDDIVFNGEGYDFLAGDHKDRVNLADYSTYDEVIRMNSSDSEG